MRRLIAFALWLATGGLLLSAPLTPAGQDLPPAIFQPPRDAGSGQPAPTGTGSISGSVVVAGTGQPARKARVTLSGAELRGGRVAITDEFGRFAFPALPAGRYTLSAAKPGYVSVTYGQRVPGPGNPGTPIQLADRQQLDVHLLMPRGGVITGTVLDEHGEAVPGTPVRALAFAVRGGERTLRQAGSGSTDDRGVYRIYGLQPGDYIVAAVPRNATINAAQIDAMRAQVEELRARVAELAADEARAATAAAERLAGNLPTMSGGDDTTTGYAPVYYPGTTLPGNAATITVGVGEEKMGIDFSLQLVPIAGIEGVVVTSGGGAAQNIRVSLVNVGFNVPGVGTASARPDREGRFRLQNVAPGHYMLTARATMPGGPRGQSEERVVELPGRGRAALRVDREQVRLWAMTPVTVDGRDLSNIVLTLQPGMTVDGRLVFEGTSTLPADLSRLRISVTPAASTDAGRQLAQSVSGRPDTAGRFTLSGVPPGRYRISASGAGGAWWLASAFVDGVDVLDFPFEVKPNESVTGMVLNFTDQSTEITGTVTNERGEPAPEYTVLVFADDSRYWQPNSRRIVSQRPGTDGRFTFHHLPPGDYRITTLLDPVQGSWYDPAFLQQLEFNAERVTLAPGGSTVQNLRVK